MSESDDRSATIPPTSEAPVPAVSGGPRSARSRVAFVLALLLVAALASTGLLAKSRSDERSRANTLAGRVKELEKRIDDLRAQADGGGTTGGSGGGTSGLGDLPSGELGDLLKRLLGGDTGSSGDLGDLGDLLGGDTGDLGNLLGGDMGSMLDCIGGLGAVQGLLGGGTDTDTGGTGNGAATLPDDNLDTQYRGVADWVAHERGLEFDKLPEPTYVTADEMNARVEKEVLREYPAAEARLDSQLLAALGAVAPGTDMRDLQARLTGGQVAGYYDPRSGELVVLSDDPTKPLTGYAVVAVAHELDHALTDQALELPVDVDKMAGASDEQMAATALIEGDATLLMYRFTTDALSAGDQMGMSMDPSATAAHKALSDAPAYLVDQMQFPYSDGLTFACGLQSKGGWRSLDSAYADPPSTTAQVLFPDRYTSHEGAINPPDPSSPGGSWKPARSRTLGAADLYWLFGAPGDERSAALGDPRGLAAGWAGGEVRQWSDGGRSAVGLSLVQHEGEPELCTSLTQWYRAAFPDATDRDVAGGLAFEDDAQSAVLHCDADNVRLGIAPDVATAARIAS